MAHRSNSQRPLLRWTGCCFALALACAFALPASSATLSHSGTFADDGSNPDSAPDTFTVTNAGISDAEILTIVINFATATTPPVEFDDTPFAFVAGAGAAATGYASQVTTTGTLTMNFTDFDAGESFTFTIDVDDNNAVVQGVRMALSQVTATFDIFGGADVTAAMADGGGNTANWTATVVPEPSTLSMLTLGLLGLAWEGRRRR